VIVARRVHQILGIRLIHHRKTRIEPDGFPVGAQQPVGYGVKGTTPDGSSVRLPVSPKALLARRNISSEALRVNVRSMIRPGSIPATRAGPPAPQEFWSCPCRPRNGKNRALACGGSAKLFGVQIVNPGFGIAPRGYVPPRPTSSH
jgi:hypothetical protein